MPSAQTRPEVLHGQLSRPQLRTVQTDDFDHFSRATQGAEPRDEFNVAEETAILQAMSLESPPGAEISPTIPQRSPVLLRSPTSISTNSSNQSPGPFSTLTTPTTPLSPATTNSSPQHSKFVSALQDVRHFAGGLVNHPYESNKHYSILRHSVGVVYYSGSSTKLAITIFSNNDLPPDRTLWLQRRGFSGMTGLKLGGLLGARSTWTNVTPAIMATAEQVDPNDERAWQRDIKKFLKKASKELRSHRPRETDILRIPCEADDGYLRVVLCTGEGKKTLCGSPVFRVVSSSLDSSVVRGSSLKTLPLEAGIKLAAVAGRTAVTATAGPYVNTARQAITSPITSVYQPSFLAQRAMTTAYDQVKVQDRFDALNEQYDKSLGISSKQDRMDKYDALARPSVVGPPSGPMAPFPVQFHGKVVAGPGRSKVGSNMPTANLTGVPEEILMRHKGVFFGWATVNLPKKIALEKNITDQWHDAIVTISPDPNDKMTVIHKNVARVYLIHDFGSTDFVDAKMSIMLMGYLRPVEPYQGQQEADMEAQQFDFLKDIAITNASLARPAWAPEATLARVKSEASSRSFSERYVDFRQTTQRHIDRVPVHRLGVRTEGAVLKDKLVGQGGIWIPRSSLYHTATA